MTVKCSMCTHVSKHGILMNIVFVKYELSNIYKNRRGRPSYHSLSTENDITVAEMTMMSFSLDKWQYKTKMAAPRDGWKQLDFSA